MLLLGLTLHHSYAQKINLEFSQGTFKKIPKIFTPLSPDQFSNKNSFWLKATIISASDKQMILKAGNWYMREISFYNEAGEFIFKGNHTEIFLKKGINRFYLYYPFADDKDNNWLTVSISSIQDFNTEYLTMRTQQVFFAASVGMLFLLSAMYSIFIRSPDKIYIRYALYLLSILIFFTYQYGILGDIFGIVNKIPPAWFWIFSDSLSITFLYFSQSFLDMKKTDPLLNRIFNFGIYLVVSMAVIEILSYLIQVDILHSLWFKGPFIVFQIGIFPYIFYRIYKQRTILSWLFLISLIIVSVANLAGQVASTFKLVSATNGFLQGATLIDTFIFSIGIAIRFGIITDDKQKIQSDLIRQLQVNEEIQEKNAAELETKVKQRTEALHKRNQENEVLVKEIHHRVKNNMQVISSMLNIAGKKIVDEKTRQPFLDSTNRINSMGLIHSFLYQNEDYPNVNTKKYITQLTQILSETFNSNSNPILFQHHVNEKVNLDMDSAINVGLIINELTTNSIKHGSYPDYTPVISISLNEYDGKNHLSVKDNGKNKPSTDPDINHNFGLRLVDALAKKLNGEVIVTNLDGFEVKVIF